MSRRLRVVQWTTGKTGGAAVRGMVGHQVLEIVGCYAYSLEKVGRNHIREHLKGEGCSCLCGFARWRLKYDVDRRQL